MAYTAKQLMDTIIPKATIIDCDWNRVILSMADLPDKAQRFLKEVGAVAVTEGGIVCADGFRPLNLYLLEANSNGWYKRKVSRTTEAFYNIYENAIYFKNKHTRGEGIRVSTAIHELTHFFLGHRLIDTEAKVEEVIKECGNEVLSNYAAVMYGYGAYAPDYDEIFCEIAGVYGSRGQWAKIRELFAYNKELESDCGLSEAELAQIGRCAICNGKYYRGGYNPAPVIFDEKARCCENCYFSSVRLARALDSGYY
jgi:hypothetical protein